MKTNPKNGGGWKSQSEEPRVMCHLVEGNLEPRCVMLRVGTYVALQVVEVHIFPGSYFVGVDGGRVVAMSEEDVVEFVLGEAFSDGSLINKGIYLPQLALESHLFHQASRGGLHYGFSVAGMAAAGVGPKARGVVFGEGTLL